ncbi:hypothetical protein [Bacillus sp. UNC438CL73TsuS30]|uniref:hypothetical protein n=1 Tax=Bacillus sp. UNC438CL73TsuS30 TaxID=1340434 RepID=UPI00047C1E88|nr:hypothetical protein [Bacillus sp. UNC438CL73TsuS30]
MKYFKQSMYILFIALFTILFFIVLKDYSTEQKVVAKIGEKKISEKELDKVLNEMYRDTALNKMVSDDLIKQEIKRLGYGPLNKEEEQKAIKYYKLVNNLKDDDNKIRNEKKKELELFYHTLQLYKKYTITQTELEKFWENEKNIVLPAKYYVKVYKDHDHSKLDEIGNKLASGVTLQEIKSQLGVDFQSVIIDESNSAFATLQGLNAGEFIHSHDYTDSNGSSHAIIIIDKVVKETNKNFKQNKEAILDYYATKKLYKEKIELINFLKSRYPVEVEKK